MLILFYSYADGNTNAIAYPKSKGYPTIHDVASGTGTYDDPITVGSDLSEFPAGTKFYSHYLSKYLIMEDDCVICDKDWTASQSPDIKIWIGGEANTIQSALQQCVTKLTNVSNQDATAKLVTINPTPGLNVDTGALFMECLALP